MGFDEQASSIKSLGIATLIFAILIAPDLVVSIPAFFVAGNLVCCMARDQRGFVAQSGTLRCCSITGIILSILNILVTLGIGMLFLTQVYTACTMANAYLTIGCSTSRRMLSNEQPLLNLVNSLGAFDKHSLSSMSKPLPQFYRTEANGEQTLLAHSFWFSTSVSKEILQTVPAHLRLPVASKHRRHLQLVNDNSCASASDSDCDDGGPGSEYSICDVGTDMTDCGTRTSADASAGSSSFYHNEEACEMATSQLGAVCGAYQTLGFVFIIYPGGCSLILLILFSMILCNIGTLISATSVAPIQQGAAQGVAMQPVQQGWPPAAQPMCNGSQPMPTPVAQPMYNGSQPMGVPMAMPVATMDTPVV